jgi:small subunit ribosomal protein S7
MSRRSTPKKRILPLDPIYRSGLVSLFINRLLKKGKKTLAQKIFYEAMEEVKLSTQKDPLIIFKEAVKNVTPMVEVKTRRVGGATFQVPIEVKPQRGTTVGLCWLIEAAQKRPGRGMVSKLAREILDASKNTGQATRKKEEDHVNAEANKAFAH